jgi:hypothetical protein
MTNLIIAYVLIAVILTAYGLTLYRRTRAVDSKIRAYEGHEDTKTQG